MPLSLEPRRVCPKRLAREENRSSSSSTSRRPAVPRRLIKSVKEVHAGPILLLSARFRRGTGSSISVARQLGVRNVLPKPFTRGELLSAVGESIDGQ